MSETVATYDGRNLEELIGLIHEEYISMYCGVNGKLYAGSDGVAFLGKFFLFDKRILLKWVDVKVQQTDHGVAIQTRDKNPIMHEFSGIHHPERCWSFLVSLHNQALLDRTSFTTTSANSATTGSFIAATGEDAPPPISSATNTSFNRRKQLRKMTSDPNKLAANIDELFSKDEEERNKDALAMNRARNSEKSRASLIEGDHGYVSMPDMDMDEQHAIEAIVGQVQGQFPCVYSKQNGTLYSGSTALYFIGDRLFFSAKVVIQSSNIRKVKMLKGKSKKEEQGIVVATRDGLAHTFLEMENPDQVWASLVALRNHVGFEETNSPRHFTLRRQNSDPSLSQWDIGSPSATHHHHSSGDKATYATGLDQTSATTQGVPLPVMSEEETKKAWLELLSDKNRYSTVVVKDHEFGCNLNKFFSKYIADDAEFSMSKYMEEKGDKELKASRWKPTTNDGFLARSRIVRYIHPINQPLSPPNPRARKEQTYQRFGDYGICVETKTHVDDVPMADCFFVKDRLLIKASKEKEGCVLVTMEFELDFVKSTMFRGVITKTTSGEMSKFFESMKDYFLESLGEQVNPQPMVEEKDASVRKEPGFVPGVSMTSITHGLLLLVIILQFWIITEISSMKQSIQRYEGAETKQCVYQPEGNFYGEQEEL